MFDVDVDVDVGGVLKLFPTFSPAKPRNIFVDTVNTKAKQYQECECETLITRIEVRIMRLKGEG